MIDHHIKAYGLQDTVEHDRGVKTNLHSVLLYDKKKIM